MSPNHRGTEPGLAVICRSARKLRPMLDVNVPESNKMLSPVSARPGDMILIDGSKGPLIQLSAHGTPFYGEKYRAMGR